MKRRFGFSLIELVLSLGLFSILLTIFLKLSALEHGRSQSVFEEQDLMAYGEVLEWTLKNTSGVKSGVWSGFKDPKTQERKFVHGNIKERTCFAEVSEEDDLYRAILRDASLRNGKIKPVEFFIPKTL